jgi:hypothetical protein
MRMESRVVAPPSLTSRTQGGRTLTGRATAMLPPDIGRTTSCQQI